MTLVRSNNVLRYAGLGKIRSDNRVRYSTQRVSGPLNRLRYCSKLRASSWRKLRYSSLSQAFLDAITYGQATDPNSLPQVSILVDGTELCPAPQIVQITHAENGPARFTIAIEDPLGYYHPKNASSPWHGKIVRNKSIAISVSWEGVDYSFEGKIKGFGHQRNFTSAGSFDLTVSGIDLSGQLFRTGVTLESLRSTRQAGYYGTKSAAASLLNQLGISHNLDLMEDTLIRLQHRQDGRPGDWFQALLDVLFHKWIFVGKTLYVYLPNPFGPPQWTYGQDAGYIMEDSYNSDAPTLTNVVTARRAKESTGGGQKQTHETFGERTITFNPPIEGLTWRKITQQNGLFSDFRLYRNNALFAVREARGSYSGGVATAPAGPCDKLTYTWGNLPGSFASQGYGEIRFMGAEEDRADSGLSSDQTYSVTYRNRTSIDAGDDENKQELAASTLHADSSTLRRQAIAVLRERAAEAEPQTFRVPLNLLMFPGQSANIVDPVLGTEKRYIRQVTQSIGSSLVDCFTRMETIYYDPSLEIEEVPEEEE